MSTNQPTGIEARVAEDIAERQRLGIAKYGTTVADADLTDTQWLRHAYEEALDLSVYLRTLIEQLEAQRRPPEPERLPTEDERAGMKWWSSLSDAVRLEMLRRAAEIHGRECTPAETYCLWKEGQLFSWRR